MKKEKFRRKLIENMCDCAQGMLSSKKFRNSASHVSFKPGVADKYHFKKNS